MAHLYLAPLIGASAHPQHEIPTCPLSSFFSFFFRFFFFSSNTIWCKSSSDQHTLHNWFHTIISSKRIRGSENTYWTGNLCRDRGFVFELMFLPNFHTFEMLRDKLINCLYDSQNRQYLPNCYHIQICNIPTVQIRSYPHNRWDMFHPDPDLFSEQPSSQCY